MTFSENRSSRKLMKDMKAHQEHEGDALSKGYHSSLPVEIKVTVKVNCLQALKSHHELMSQTDKDLLSEKFGRIADLLYVKPQELAILVMMNFWDPSLRVFTFEDMDTTPTIEEYGLILGIHLNSHQPIYVPKQVSPSLHEIAALFGTSYDQVKKSMVKRGETIGWELNYILKILDKFKFCCDGRAYLNLFSLIIYGTVLFPSAMGIVDQRAIDIFLSVLHNEVNPIPAILADTFLSLNHSRRNGKGNLRCSIHMLYVWICNHVFWKRYRSYGPIPKPVERFLLSPIEQKDKKEWIDVFQSVNSSSYAWSLSGMEANGILLCCGDFQCVPLIGSRGCISYSPAMVLRQYGRMQYIPRTRCLKEVEFEYRSSYSKELWEQIQIAWQSIEIKDYKEVGPFGRWTTPEYPQWFKERGKDVVLTRMINTEKPSSITPDPQDYKEQENIRGKLDYAKVTEELKKVTGEKRKKDEECKQLIEKIQKIEEENEKHCVNLARTSQAKTNALTSKVRQLSEAIDEQQGHIDMCQQKITYLEEDAQRLRIEKSQALDDVVERDETIAKLESKNSRLESEIRCINHLRLDRENIIQQYKQAVDKNEELINEAELNLTKLAARVKAIEDQVTPFKLPEKELIELYNETKELLEIWSRN